MYEAIPEELKALDRWVCADNGSKIPRVATAFRFASSTNPATWSSFRDASKAVQMGYYDHLGFVFNGDGYVGIDIDDGYDSNNALTPLAWKCMALCQSYTEQSRSGRGIHIILRGRLPFKGKNNRAGVEIYREARYFIMTGNCLVYHDIIENQKAIDTIVETYFPDVQKETDGFSTGRIYCPVYPRANGRRVPLRPIYPPIGQGSRNLSLASLAGQLHNQGYDPETIYGELLIANTRACEPPLPTTEVESIVRSVTRYRR